MTALYRHYGEAGRLLYVGISLNAIARLSQHRSTEWFLEIARVDVTWFADRKSAMAAERLAIKTEYPVFNRKGRVAGIPRNYCRVRWIKHFADQKRQRAAERRIARARAKELGLDLHF